MESVSQRVIRYLIFHLPVPYSISKVAILVEKDVGRRLNNSFIPFSTSNALNFVLAIQLDKQSSINYLIYQMETDVESVTPTSEK